MKHVCLILCLILPDFTVLDCLILHDFTGVKLGKTEC